MAEWVEDILLDFLDAYLRIDRGRDGFSDEPVTDPVCGMRIARSAAAARENFQGHAYVLCSSECQEAFLKNPREYVSVKTL